MARSRFLPDNFTLALLGTVAVASVLPASGVAAQALEGLTVAAVALLFFLHGAKLSRDAIVAGLSHWRLHLVVVGATFVLFPLLGWALRPVLQGLVTPGLYTGILYLCVLPATVQSAIAFTRSRPAMARVTYGRTVPGPATHQALVVTCDGQEWLVDVGFGGPGPERPLPLLGGKVHTVEGAQFRLVPSFGGDLHLQRKVGSVMASR